MNKRSVDKPIMTILPKEKPSGITINAMDVFMKDKDHTIGSLDAFLHDVWEGESEFEEVLNIMGYNELRYVVDRAKLFEVAIKSQSRIIEDFISDMEDIKERLIEVRGNVQTAKETTCLEDHEDALYNANNSLNYIIDFALNEIDKD